MAHQIDHEPQRRSTGRNRRAYESAQRQLDVPLTVLAVALGIILCVQFFGNPSEATNATLDVVTWLIWAAFLLEYLLLLWLAPSRREMIRTHKLDLFLIVVPFLRPLRVLRLLRVIAGFGSGFMMARRVMARRGMQWVIVSVLLIIVAGATLTMIAERQDPEAAIVSFGTALWWAVVTSTTVGYGDVAPITPAGRAIAVVLMIVGIALLSIVTANVASMFVEQDVQDENDELRSELAAMNAKLDLLLRSSGVTHTN